LKSGDFLRVVQISETLGGDRVTLRRYPLRRTKYLAPQFSPKLNELFMHLRVDPTDPRKNGLVSMTPDNILRKRDCTITDMAYEKLNFRNLSRPLPSHLTTNEEVFQWFYSESRLFCRWINIIYLENGKDTWAGEVRRVSGKEVIASRTIPAATNGSTPALRRSPWIEIVNDTAEKVPQCKRCQRYTFGDVFCGIGGASQGASDAGLTVFMDVDNDENCIEGYRENFEDSGAIALQLDADCLPTIMDRKNFGVHILHLSCPCQYWSPCHPWVRRSYLTCYGTLAGKNDQENVEALLTVGPIVETLQPRIVTLEQTSGLIRQRKHRQYWRNLVNQLLEAGYNVRYTVSQFFEFGLPASRRRLLVVAAKCGTPLPPFPEPTHGVPGSGLKPLVSVHEALRPLAEVEPDDDWHQPDKLRKFPKHMTPYDPKTRLARCITTDGGEDNCHFSGTRNFTVREQALLQGFPTHFRFSGSTTAALRQVGNAFPPTFCSKLFLLCAQTLEAFDHGFINADEEISDLYDTLTAKGVDFEDPPEATRDLFNGRRRSKSKFLYLNRLEKSKISHRKIPMWGRIPVIHSDASVESGTAVGRAPRVVPNFGAGGGSARAASASGTTGSCSRRSASATTPGRARGRVSPTSAEGTRVNGSTTGSPDSGARAGMKRESEEEKSDQGGERRIKSAFRKDWDRYEKRENFWNGFKGELIELD
ncbi:S-adenosyl-L-methionine-dependent methyltransferase, partial [Sporormia fimetaria CBS 119925]